MVIVGVAWVPIIMNMQGAQLYIYIQSVAAYFSPPIAAVYLLAVLWTGANEPVTPTFFISNSLILNIIKSKGAFWSLMSGLLIGVIRMVLDFIYIEPACGEDDHRPSIVKDVMIDSIRFDGLFELICLFLVSLHVFRSLVVLCNCFSHDRSQLDHQES